MLKQCRKCSIDLSHLDNWSQSNKKICANICNRCDIDEKHIRRIRKNNPDSKNKSNEQILQERKICVRQVSNNIKKCARCKSELELYKNWTEHRQNASDYICNGCNLKRAQNHTPEQKAQKLKTESIRLQKPEVKIKNTENRIKRKQRETAEAKRKRLDKNNKRKQSKKHTAEYQMLEFFRGQTRRLFDAIGTHKNGTSSRDYLDDTKENYKIRIEQLFSLPSNLVNGKMVMTWENKGAYWHIDHIKPLSFYSDITDRNDLRVKELLSIDNLRPLKGVDNIARGNRVTIEQIAEIKQEISDFIIKLENNKGLAYR